MNTFDWIIIFLIFLFMFNSFRNGFIEEILSIGSLLISFFVAYKFAYIIEPYFDFFSNDKLVVKIFTMVFLFTVIYIFLKLIKEFLFNFIENNNLSDIDRILGLILGFIKGVVIISVIIWLLSYINAVQVKHLLETSLISRNLLPLINEYKSFII